MIKPGRPPDSSGIRTLSILIAVIAVLYLAREIFIPLAIAVMLTLILTPPVAWLQRKHLGRVPSVLLVIVVSGGVAGWIGCVIFSQLLDVANELPSYQQNIHNKIQAMRAPTKNALGRAADSVKELGQELATGRTPTPPPGRNEAGGRRNTPGQASHPLPVRIVEEPTNEVAYWRDLSQPFWAPLGIFGIVLIFTVFLLIEQDDLRNRLLRLAGLDRLNVMTQALEDAGQRVSRYPRASRRAGPRHQHEGLDGENIRVARIQDVDDVLNGAIRHHCRYPPRLPTRCGTCKTDGQPQRHRRSETRPQRQLRQHPDFPGSHRTDHQCRPRSS